MHYLGIRRALRGAALFVLALAAAAAWADPQPAPPPRSAMQGVQSLPQDPPLHVVLYHARFDLRPDFTYTEQAEARYELPNDMGVRMSREMPVGVSSAPLPMAGNARKVEVLSAYTLKKNGQRVPAAPSQGPSLPPGVVPPKDMPPMPKMTWMSFPNAEVGDTLVVSYKATQEAADPPDHVVLNQVLTRFWIWDDVQISLSAPAAMKLRFSMQGMDAPQHTSAGDTQQWTWKASNRTVVKPSPGMPPFSNAIALHITSFPTADEETAYYTKAISAMGRPTMNLADPCFNSLMPNDGPPGMDAVAGLLANLYQHDPAGFEGAVKGLNSPQCVLEDGRPKLTALNSAYDTAFNYDHDWQKSYQYITQLKKDYPRQAFVSLAEAEYWIRYAWEARGSGYASSVAQEGWNLFGERLQKAEKVLLDSKAYAADYPLWYADMTQVEFLLDRPAHDRAAIVEEGLKRYSSYYQLYFTMENFMSPKWYGNWEAVDGFVNWSVEATKKTEAQTLYARLYWYAYQNLRPDEQLFRDTKASWPRMKKGFDDLMARHPGSAWNLNNFAHFACMAGDKKTFRKLRKKMGRNVIDQAWQAQPTLDLCEAKYGA